MTPLTADHPRIIALYSSRPQCGKSTASTYLERTYDFRRISFADPLRTIVETLLINLGYPRDQAHHLVRNDKAAVIPQLRMTVRQLLRVTGTEYLRDCVHPDVNVMMWKHRTQEALTFGHRVVVDDLRYPNEYDAIRALGGAIWCIDRPSAPPPEGDHPSDGALTAHKFDCYLYNDHTLEGLHRLLETSLRIPTLVEGGAA